MTFWSLAVPNPDAPALVFGKGLAAAGTVSYRDLAGRADGLAERRGAPAPKQLWAILCRNEPEALYAYLGALRAGDAVMLLHEQTIPSLLQPILDAYRPEWLFLPKQDALPARYQAHAQEGEWQILRRQRADCAAALHSDLAVLLSTSGTTGSPKMVRLSYNNIAVNARSIVAYLQITAEERAMTTLPFNYSYGMSVVNSHLLAGAVLVLTEASLLTREFWETFSFQKGTSLAGVPYTYQMLHRLNPHKLDLSTLRTLTQAGGRLSLPLMDYFRQLSEQQGWRFFVMYGQTEAAPRISYVPPGLLAAKAGSIGIPIPGGRLSLSKDQELIYEGANVMMGYSFRREDLAKGDELDGTLFTGDLATMDQDGYFFLHGRLKRFVKIHGNRINLDDLEQRLEEQLHLPAAVVGQDDHLQIFLSAGTELETAKALITAFFRLHPTTFRLRQIEAIPHTPAGKKDYSRLP